MKLSKTETAREVIVLDVAVNGKLTRDGIRAYTENRISKTTLNALVDIGLNKFKQFGGNQNGKTIF